MPYLSDKSSGVRQIRRGPGPRPTSARSILTLMGVGGDGMGDFSDTDQCSTIPIGDPYRKPGNYCATPDGGSTTFNSDGTTYRAPGAVDPDPAHPSGSSGGSGGSSSSDGIWGAIGKILGGVAAPPTAVPVVPASGMSTTTMLLLAGGAVAVVAIIARRK